MSTWRCPTCNLLNSAFTDTCDRCFMNKNTVGRLRIDIRKSKLRTIAAALLLAVVLGSMFFPGWF